MIDQYTVKAQRKFINAAHQVVYEQGYVTLDVTDDGTLRPVKWMAIADVEGEKT